MKKNKILIIDIETTGFMNQGGKIVEVGMVELDVNTGEKQILYDKVFRPYGMSIDEIERSWIVENKYMTAGDIIQAPHIEQHRHEIQEIIDDYFLGATAYNNQFDFSFLESIGITFHTKLPCPMKISTNIVKIPSAWGYKWPKVQEAWDFFFGSDTGYIEKHRGADDAFHEADIVFELIKRGKFKF